MSNNYRMIPAHEITDGARKIAVLWVDGLKYSSGLGIAQKHKLASDIMNYANEFAAEKDKEITRLKSNLPHGQEFDKLIKRSKSYDSIKLLVDKLWDSIIAADTTLMDVVIKDLRNQCLVIKAHLTNEL